MYWILAVILFFVFPPVGTALLFAGIALNLLVNLLDYLHVQKLKAADRSQQRRQYS